MSFDPLCTQYTFQTNMNMLCTKSKSVDHETSSMSDKDFVVIGLKQQNVDSHEIERQIMFHHTQLTQSVLSNGSASKEGSLDGWSQISCPLSHRSSNSIVNVSRKASFDMEGSTEGTAKSWRIVTGSGSVENCSITSNGPIFSSPSTTREISMEQCMASLQTDVSRMANHHQCNHNMNDANTIGSVGSRVPFSWAEITKIQPKFHNDMSADSDHQKPKVFDQTPKIELRHLKKQRANIESTNNGNGSGSGNKSNGSNSKRNQRNKIQREDILMPSIPEADPSANKSDLGRRVRKAGKRGSRLKYPNGKKGGNKNRRKKHCK